MAATILADCVFQDAAAVIDLIPDREAVGHLGSPLGRAD
jgi:hypothetical protein